mmetsp:Transcript_23731/g.43073  ORF Transcript_23731/g.43073 Transcript_23731/m.43073 type:complete len:200 (+) Transcript_23731:73-672(+)
MLSPLATHVPDGRKSWRSSTPCTGTSRTGRRRGWHVRGKRGWRGCRTCSSKRTNPFLPWRWWKSIVVLCNRTIWFDRKAIGAVFRQGAGSTTVGSTLFSTPVSHLKRHESTKTWVHVITIAPRSSRKRHNEVIIWLQACPLLASCLEPAKTASDILFKHGLFVLLFHLFGNFLHGNVLFSIILLALRDYQYADEQACSG